MRPPLKRPAKEASEVRKALKAALETVDDERATAGAKLLSKTVPDLTALARLASGEDGHDAQRDLQSMIRAVEVPDPAAAVAIAADLDRLDEQLRTLGAQQGELDQQREHLLGLALQLQEESGETECPVCQAGHLDEDWRRRTSAAYPRPMKCGPLVSGPNGDYRTAELCARKLMAQPPSVTRQTMFDLPSQTATFDLWAAWSTPDPAVRLSDHLRNRPMPLAEAVGAWQAEAQALADEAADRWRPLAVRITAYVGH